MGSACPSGAPHPWGVRFVSQPCLTVFSGCSCVYERVFISRSVLGCVTFSTNHQPVFRVPAGSELLVTAPIQRSEPRLFTRHWQLVLASITPCPALGKQPSIIPTQSCCAFCRDCHSGASVEALSPCGDQLALTHRSGGLGCGLAASLLPELGPAFGEAQGAGWTRECRAGPRRVTPEPSLHGWGN